MASEKQKELILDYCKQMQESEHTPEFLRGVSVGLVRSIEFLEIVDEDIDSMVKSFPELEKRDEGVIHVVLTISATGLAKVANSALDELGECLEGQPA